ncbi:MAG TPA: ankyrin repeat domain-containing protein, partial [Gaiellaceae bacterium]
LVAAGADLEAPSRNQEVAPEARPLHSAVAAGRMDNAEALLDAGADANARQHGGYTPLMAAEQAGNLDLAELLIRHGAFAGGGG